MKISRTGSFAAICAGAAMLVAAPIANAGVNIIYPPKLASDFDQPDEAPAADKTVVKVKVFINPHTIRDLVNRRHFYATRALFQNYAGFRKVYSGRKYPF